MTTALRPPREVRSAPEFRPFEHPAWLAPAARLIAESDWIQHIPFGMYLVDAVRPRLLVELGTGAGASYSAFCQAIQERELATQACAVDRWPRAEVLEQLRGWHDSSYASFSRLLQTTFDEAARQFGDGEIDLLHLDGSRDFATVQHDFDTWLPKLSRRGVVLLAGTQARDEGSWRLWSELREQHPHFELLEGRGLGLLAIGPDVPSQVRALVEADDATVALVRNFFFVLGHRLTLEAGIRARQSAHDAQLQQLRELLQREQQTFRELGGEMLALRNARDHLATQLAELRQSATMKFAARAWKAKDNTLERLPSTRKLYDWLERKLRSLV